MRIQIIARGSKFWLYSAASINHKLHSVTVVTIGKYFYNVSESAWAMFVMNVLLLNISTAKRLFHAKCGRDNEITEA